ncbi:hypothetical protein SBOR_0444 [Sclerotinia borealis F-4128]|uniref:Uncharacterized protein n=1 Tax=Sclerotinia borealis (strain F-4128) TaxID=1432307 RepID=W9CX41_SCLBF|nr:hypothetical protein SBOR_0444 [Sclerotinia borealis F-4128]
MSGPVGEWFYYERSTRWRAWETGILLMAMDFTTMHGEYPLSFEDVSDLVISICLKLIDQYSPERYSMRWTLYSEQHHGDTEEEIAKDAWSKEACREEWFGVQYRPKSVQQTKATLRVWMIPALRQLKDGPPPPDGDEDTRRSDLLALRLAEAVDLSHQLPGEGRYPLPIMYDYAEHMVTDSVERLIEVHSAAMTQRAKDLDAGIWRHPCQDCPQEDQQDQGT